MNYTPKLPDESVNYGAQHPLAEMLKLGGALLALLVALYFVLGWSVDLLAERLSPTFEKKMMRLIAHTLPKQSESSELENLTASLQGCIDLPYQPRVVLAESKEINAYALPGGTIVINRGLLAQSRSENELTFIIAHELGHFAHRDHPRGMARALVGMSIVTLLGFADAPDILGMGMRWGESRFSQKQEYAADLYALDLLACRYGHVGGATDFFARQKERDPVKWLLFASHPELEARIRHLEAAIGRKGYLRKATQPALF